MRARPLILAAAFAATCLIAQAQTPVITSIGNNAAPGVGTLVAAPGELVNVIGTNLGDSTQMNCGSQTGFTTACGGVSVMVAGKAAGVRNENATTVIIQVPVDAPLGSAQVVLTRTVSGTAMPSAPFNITIVAVAPQIYGMNANGVAVANCFDSSNVQITPSHPAGPGDTVYCLGTGFGVTNPVVPTGMVVSPPLPVVVATVHVSVANTDAMVRSALLQGNFGVGQVVVRFDIPLSTPAGNQPIMMNVGGVDTVTRQIPIAITGPKITAVENAASQLSASLPNGGVAQGAIFLLLGVDLGPADIVVDTMTPFQHTSLSGTSVAITVGNTTTNALMYYTASGYVSALLPSNTPVGAGMVTVTYNGQMSAPVPINVVAHNVGVFTYTQDGAGIAIVTYPDFTLVSSSKAADCGTTYDTSCGAANPKDVLILWATGLGAINGSDAAGDGLGQDMPNVPVQIWLGGVPAVVGYRGRSGYRGEDQIVFTIPDNAPTGCAVPMAVQIGDQISNGTVIAIANGSRSCKMTNGALSSLSSADILQAISSPPLTFADLKLNHQLDNNAYTDFIRFETFKIQAVTPLSEPFFPTYVDNPAFGTCLTVKNLQADTPSPITQATPADAGSSFTIRGPNGQKMVPGASGDSRQTLDSTGNFLVPGNYTVTSTGGLDIGAMNVSITMPKVPTFSSPSLPTTPTITRSNGMTFTWNPAGASGYLVLFVGSATESTFNNGASVACFAPANAGTFTVPAYAMQSLPAGNFATYAVLAAATEVPFTANGLTVGVMEATSDGPTGPVILQ